MIVQYTTKELDLLARLMRAEDYCRLLDIQESSYYY